MELKISKPWAVFLWVAVTIILLAAIYGFISYFSNQSLAIDAEDKKLALTMDSWKTVGQFVAAIVLAFGLYWTARNVRVAEKNAEIARDNTEIARKNSEVTKNTATKTLEISQASLEATKDGKFAERYSKAIELLGKRNGDKIDAVSFIGGVYALERLAHESPKDHWTIMELLVTLARQQIEPLRANKGVERSISREVQAIFNVLGRRNVEYDSFAEGISEHAVKEHVLYFQDLIIQGASFRSLCFPKGWFINTEFHGCDFRGAQLQGAMFQRAAFHNYCLFGDQVNQAPTFCTGADFMGAKFENAHLNNTDFSHCMMMGVQFGPRAVHNQMAPVDPYSVDLTGVNFSGADLCSAYFVPGSQITGANFQGANLGNTQLGGVDLERSFNLTVAQVQRATLDTSTKLPALAQS